MHKERKPSAPLGRQHWSFRPLLVATALVLEYLVIAFAFDLRPALQRGGDWEHMRPVRDVAVVALVAFLIGIGVAARGRAPVRAQSLERGWVLAHAAGYLVFLGLTGLILGSEEPPWGPPDGWLALWGASGAASTLLLLRAVLGGRFFARRTLAVAGVAVLIAMVSIEFGMWAQAHGADALWATLFVSAALLRLFYDDVTMDPDASLLGAGGFDVWVDTPCSGIEGVGLAAVLIPAYLWVFRRELRFPNALLMVPLGILGVWLANAFRIATLMVVAIEISPTLALGAFHSKLGWIYFCAATLGMAYLGQRVPLFAQTRGRPAAVFRGNATAAYLLPLLGLLTVSQLTGLFAAGHDPYYGLRIAIALAVLLAYRQHYSALLARPGWFGWLSGGVVGVLWLVVRPTPEMVPVKPELSGAWLAIRALGSTLVVPLAEELAFRGFVLRRLQSSDFEAVPFRRWTLLSVLVSSLLFGVLHARWLAAGLAGLVFAVAQIRRGRFADALAAHVAANAVISLWALTTGDLSEW